MRAQRELGVDIDEDSANSEKVKAVVDLDAIRKREQVTSMMLKQGWKSSPKKQVISTHIKG